MQPTTPEVQFTNQVHPNSSFDLLRLEDLYEKTDLDHNIESHHKVEFYLIFFVTEGQGTHTVDFKNHKISKGSMLSIRKDQIQKFDRRSSVKGFLPLFTKLKCKSRVCCGSR